MIFHWWRRTTGYLTRNGQCTQRDMDGEVRAVIIPPGSNRNLVPVLTGMPHLPLQMSYTLAKAVYADGSALAWVKAKQRRKGVKVRGWWQRRPPANMSWSGDWRKNPDTDTLELVAILGFSQSGFSGWEPTAPLPPTYESIEPQTPAPRPR